MTRLVVFMYPTCNLLPRCSTHETARSVPVLVIIMEAKALYDFARSSSSSIGLKAGQLFDVEQQGTNGWTLIKTKDGSEKGWAPSSYLEILQQKEYSTQELARGLAEALKQRSN